MKGTVYPTGDTLETVLHNAGVTYISQSGEKSVLLLLVLLGIGIFSAAYPYGAWYLERAGITRMPNHLTPRCFSTGWSASCCWPERLSGFFFCKGNGLTQKGASPFFVAYWASTTTLMDASLICMAMASGSWSKGKRWVMMGPRSTLPLLIRATARAWVSGLTKEP